MSRQFTCPQGHQWDLSETSSSLATHLDPVCPVCGAAAMGTISDPGRLSDSGKVRMALGPAPMETKARVPAPLPVREAQVSAPAPVAPRASENVWAQKMQSGARAETPREDLPRPPNTHPQSVISHPLVIGLSAVIALMLVAGFIAIVSFSRRIAHERDRYDEASRAAQAAERTAAELRADLATKQSRGADEAQELRNARDEAIEQREKGKQDVKRADAARQVVEKQRQEQAEFRERAEVAAKVAEQSRDEVQKARSTAEGKLVQLYAGQGTRAMERGEFPEAFVYLTEALRLGHSDPRQETVQRMRLASVIAACPKPLQVWFHDKPVTHFEMSADGRRVLTVSKDGKARLFDAATGQLIGEPLTGNAAISIAHFSHDGARVATAAQDQMARVWDAASGKAITAPMEHPGLILALAFSSDGKRLHTVSRGATTTATGFHAWDAATGDAIGDPWQFGHPVQSARFTPDGRLVLTIGLDGRAYLTDLSGKNSSQAFESTGALQRLTFSSDGQFAGTFNSDKTARVWNVGKRTAISPPLVHPDLVQQIAVSPDGQRAATSCADRIVRVWNVQTGQRILQARQPSVVSALSFSSDGRHLLTANQDGIARVINAESGVEIVPALLHSGATLPDAALVLDGARALTADEQAVRLWDLTGGEPLTATSDTPNRRVTYSPDGKLFVRVTGDSAQLYATETGKAVGAAIKHKNDIALTAFSADGKRLLTVAQKPGQDSADVELRVSDTATGQPAGRPIELISLVQHAAISPDGVRLSAATAEQKVYLWESASGKEIGRPLDLRQNVTHVLFSPDGSKLITATATGDVRVHDPATGEPISPAMKHGQAVTLVAVTADSKRLLTARADGSAQVLDATTGETIVGPFSHDSAVSQFALSDDGTRAVTAGTDGTARIWDTKTGKSTSPPLHHNMAVSQAAFSPAARWLATASGDRIYLWDAATGESLRRDIRPWRGGAAVRHLEFTKEGKLIASYGQPGDLRARQAVSIEAESRAATDLAQVGVVLTGHHLDSAGAFAPAELDESRKAWDALRAKTPKEFAASPEALLAWYRRGADECEQVKNWAGVLRHVKRLAELEPKRVEYRSRRARTFVELGRWQDAVGEYRKALDVEPKNVELLIGIARAEIEQKHWQPATEWLDRAIAITGEDAELWVMRGRASAELGKFDKAATDLDKAMSLGRNDSAIWYQRNLLRLAAGDLDGYRKACLRMVRRFGDGNTASTRWVGWTCSLGPEALTDLKPVIRRLERAVTETPTSVPERLVLAFLLYRTGQFAQSASMAEVIVKSGGENTAPVLLSMIQHRLGRTEEAKKGLDKTLKPDDAGIASLTWDERLAYKILHGEAETLLKNPKP
jgi:WD40 repeat protein